MTQSIKKILFPTDFSQTSLMALNAAINVAEKYEAELHLVSVGDTSVYAYAPYIHLNAEDDIFAGTRTHLNEIKLPAAADNLTVKRTLLTGFVGDEIKSYVAENDIDLVVMASHSRGHVARFLLGSVADRLLRTLDCPILLLRAPKDKETETGIPDAKEFKDILVPVDFSATSDLGVERAVGLAKDYGAKLHFLHVIDALPFKLLDENEIKTVQKEKRESAFAKLEDLVATAASGLNTSLSVVIGSPEEKIADYLKSNPIDLLVAGSHGRSGLNRLVLGSVVDSIVRSVNCPIFVEHAGTSRA